MTEITDAVPHELRNLLIGALLDCIDDNMLEAARERTANWAPTDEAPAALETEEVP